MDERLLNVLRCDSVAFDDVEEEGEGGGDIG